MKISRKVLSGAILSALLLTTLPVQAITQPPKVGIVNFKTCVENSKLGKQEQGNFEKMKNQMESVLKEKEKALTELSNKFNDADYIDSLSSDAEAELKHKFRSLNQEFAQHQQQYMQILQQANYKIIQKISDEIGVAANTVAKNKNLNLILNSESAFFVGPTLDISDEIVKVLDAEFKEEAK